MHHEAMEGFTDTGSSERRCRILRAALGDLDAFDVQVLLLRWGDSLTRMEAARVLGREASAILAAEYRIRAWMRQRIEAAEFATA
jgi:DNA-directed RNA polymerase specialized sigma24 family protein